MKVKELKDILNALPKEADDREVIIARDEEGNGFNVLEDVNINDIYFNDEIYHDDTAAEDNCLEKNEWEKIKNDPSLRVISIWP